MSHSSLLALQHNDLNLTIVLPLFLLFSLRFLVKSVDALLLVTTRHPLLVVFNNPFVCVHFEIGKANDCLDFTQERPICLLVACLKLASIGYLRGIEGVLELGNSVELLLSIYLGLNVVYFIFGRLKTVRNLLQYFQDSLLVCLCIVPFNHSFVELVLHLAHGPLVLIHGDLVHGPLY